MAILFTLLSLGLIFLVLVDAFETIVLPRRVTHPYRFARFFYRSTWKCWAAAALLIRANKWRQTFLSLFGPLSLLTLFVLWALGLILGFALLHWALSTALNMPGIETGFGAYLYYSGVTFFTLGYGDVVPITPAGRALAVAEAGMGFGFMAVIIGYLPVLYQAFSTREMTISLLDARAGSPPSAAEFLRRVAGTGQCSTVEPFLVEWERWAAQLLESHLSFPVLSFYRSQHDNQSWLAALTAVLDICTLLLAAVKDGPLYQAQLTFAMARHAAVDLALVFQVPPLPPEPDRLPAEQWHQLRKQLVVGGLPLRDEPVVTAKLEELRGLYEPFVNALAHRLLFALPPIVPAKSAVDNWQTTAWTRRAPGIGKLPADGDEHFD
jgi:Ion channel